MENQNQVPQTQPSVPQVPTYSTPTLAPEPSRRGKIWKIIGIILISIVVLFSLLVWYGSRLEKQDQNLSNNPKLAKETNQEGYSLLHFAVLNVDEGAVKVLLDAKADANQIYTFTRNTPDGGDTHTPLTYLLDNYSKLGSAHSDENKTLNIIDALDKHGAKLNFPYIDESGAIKPPIFYNRLVLKQNILKKLVEDGADINLGGFKGQTLLYDKLSGITEPDDVKFLLSLGADPNRKANDDTTPADAFCDSLIDFQKRPEGQFPESWKKSAQQIADMLRAKGVTLNCKI